MFNATRYFLNDGYDCVDDDEVIDDCIEMVVLKFKLLTTLDNNLIDIRSVKDLEKKNHTINQLGKLTEEITKQQLSVADIEKLAFIVNELNEAIKKLISKQLKFVHKMI